MDGDDLLARYPAVPRRLLSVDDYHRMAAAGILAEDDRVELVEGELVAKAPIGSEHAATLNAATSLLVMAVGKLGIVGVRNPLRLDFHNEPEPDIAILRPRADGYRRELPGPKDVLLVVEVAVSSLAFDRGPKRALYARYGVPELWIVDLAAGEVETHRLPATDEYGTVVRFGATASLAIAALPGIQIPVAPLLGLDVDKLGHG